jgi:hypothetical protein
MRLSPVTFGFGSYDEAKSFLDKIDNKSGPIGAANFDPIAFSQNDILLSVEKTDDQHTPCGQYFKTSYRGNCCICHCYLLNLTRVEGNGSVKCSVFLQHGNNYGCKFFYSTVIG